MPTFTADGDNKDLSSVLRRYVDTYTGPSSYATGGDPIVAGDVGLGRIFACHVGLAVNAAGTIYLLRYFIASAVMKWYVPSTGVEVANATNLSGFSAHLEFVGK